MNKKTKNALKIAFDYGSIDGAHHKMWVIDQMVRELLGSQAKYDKWIKDFCDGEDGPCTYSWNIGIAP